MQLPVTSLGKELRVEWIDFYGDRVMHAAISDKSGNRTEICIDRRNESPTRFRLFQQARHPDQPGAVLVELGAVAEGIVIPLLSYFLDRGPRASGLTEYGWEMARESLLRYGEPILQSELIDKQCEARC